MSGRKLFSRLWNCARNCSERTEICTWPSYGLINSTKPKAISTFHHTRALAMNSLSIEGFKHITPPKELRSWKTKGRQVMNGFSFMAYDSMPLLQAAKYFFRNNEDLILPALHPGFGNYHRRHFSTACTSHTDFNIRYSSSGTMFYFDTHKLVKELQMKGFSLEQAEALTSTFTDIVNSSSDATAQYMVTRNELNQLELKMNSIIEALRKDMVILEKSEFLLLKAENEKMKSEVTLLNRTLNDELLKLRSSITLDISLEKGRVKEQHSLQDQKIKDTSNRIDTEIARIRTDLEAQKLDLIKYLVGCTLSILTILVGVWRYLKS